MGTIAAVAIGGAAGASARYGLDRLVEERAESLFPWATFTINITGCLLSALLVTIVVERLGAPTWIGVGLITGFVASYTTFSTLAFETYELIELRHVLLAVTYVTTSVVTGVAAIVAGQWIGRTL